MRELARHLLVALLTALAEEAGVHFLDVAVELFLLSRQLESSGARLVALVLERLDDKQTTRNVLGICPLFDLGDFADAQL